MLIRCKSTFYHPQTFQPLLRVGCYYDVLDIDSVGYRIIDETGTKSGSWYYTDYFVPVEESREEKIDSIVGYSSVGLNI
jgi:hypothetical protein